jgi:hypothetical protein
MMGSIMIGILVFPKREVVWVTAVQARFSGACLAITQGIWVSSPSKT